MMLVDNSNQVYNRFVNLDAISERIINYLITSDSIYANRIWKLLKYSDSTALLQDNLTQEERAKLVDDDGEEQSNKRIFRYPIVEDTFSVKSSILRIYIDSVVPTNNVISVVNIGIDIISNSKLSNVYNDANDELENPKGYVSIENEIMLKSRSDVLLKNILAELNGKDIQGVGQLVFTHELSPFNQAKLGFFNNKNYFGYKLVMSCMQSGVS